MGLGRLASRPALRHENAAADPDGSSVRRSVAQWLEHRSPKPGAGGSSPSTPATYSSNQLISFGCDTARRFGATILVRGAVHASSATASPAIRLRSAASVDAFACAGVNLSPPWRSVLVPATAPMRG